MLSHVLTHIRFTDKTRFRQQLSVQVAVGSCSDVMMLTCNVVSTTSKLYHKKDHKIDLNSPGKYQIVLL